jgi:hypothetical protein
MTDLQQEFEKTGYSSWINSEIYPNGKIYTQEYVEWLEKSAQQYKDRVAELEREWVSVDERLPEIGERVLVFCQSQGTQMCYRGYHNHGISWMMVYNMSKAELNITNWMPLPPLPQPPKHA